MLSPNRSFRYSFAWMAVALAACGCGDGGTTPPPTPKGFSVSLSSTTLSVVQGATGTITATIGRTGEFSGTVNLSTESLPAGITATFNPAAITTSTTSTTLSVGVAASVAPGNYSFSIRGQAAGLSDQTATVAMTVTARPAIAIALTPTNASVQAGANTTLTATVARTNFAGAVTVAISGAPAGVTTTITTAGDVHTVAVAVGVAVPAGAITLTVAASGTGVESVTAPFALTVTAAAAPSIALTAVPAALSIQATGAAAASTITIARTNFVGAVALAVQSGLPAHVTATVTTSPTPTNSASISFGANANATPGTYTVVVEGTGTGVSPATVQISLTVTAAPPASIALTATPPTLSLQAGGATASTTLDITRTNFTGTVVIAVQSGLPPNVTETHTAAGVGNSSTMIFIAAANAVPGVYTVVVQGAGFQATAGTVSIGLTVTAAPSSIALSATPASVSVQQGASGNTTINIARSNFAGSVTLAASSVPNGVTPTFTTSPTTASTATLGLAVGASVPTGSYPITITGSGAGIANAPTTVTLNVTQASSGGNVIWQFCTLTEIPIWLAVQNGNSSAPWTQVASGPNNTYTFSISSQGGVAFVSQVGANDYSLGIVYGTATELSGQRSGQCSLPNTKSVTGTASGFGITNSDLVSIALGSAFASPAPTFAQPNFTINNAPDGLRDLLGTRSAFDINNAAAGFVLNKIFIKRGLNPPNGGSVGTVDFNGADAFSPDTKQLTINGLAGGETVSASNSFITNTQSFASLGLGVLSAGTTYNMFTVPSAKTVTGDVNAISATAADIVGSQVLGVRSVTSAFRDPANQTLTLGAALNTPTVSVAATAPYARLRTQVTRQSDYQNFWTTSYAQNSTSVRRSVTIQMQAGYIGGASTFDVTVPDFAGVGGWQNVWGLVTGTSTAWNVSAFGWVTGTGGLEDGSVFRVGQRPGTITP